MYRIHNSRIPMRGLKGDTIREGTRFGGEKARNKHGIPQNGSSLYKPLTNARIFFTISMLAPLNAWSWGRVNRARHFMYRAGLRYRMIDFVEVHPLRSKSDVLVAPFKASIGAPSCLLWCGWPGSTTANPRAAWNSSG